MYVLTVLCSWHVETLYGRHSALNDNYSDQNEKNTVVMFATWIFLRISYFREEKKRQSHDNALTKTKQT